MQALTCNIEIGDFEFDYCVNVEIQQDISTLTDTCTISIPRKTSWNGKNIAIGDDPIIKRGDVVKVRLGYDGFLKTRFIGFIKNIKAGMPVTIECDDTMFLLKRTPITKTYSSVSVQKLLDDIIPKGIEYRWASDKDIQLGALRLNRVSAAKVLEELKSKMGLYSYFRNIPFKLADGTIDAKPVLYVGLAYWFDNRNEEIFEFGYNIINPYELEYRRKEDVRLKAKAISWQSNNTKIEIEVGDDDGEQRTLHYYGLDKNQLEIRARAELERFKYTGYAGSLLTYGVPEVEKGDVANLIGNQYHPDGKYLIKSVRVKFGTGGYRQTIEPGQIISDAGNITAISS